MHWARHTMQSSSWVNCTLEEFIQDKQLIYAISYSLIIVGEALNAVSEHRSDSALAQAIPELREIIATRNRIVHGYDDIDEPILWSIVDDGLPTLIEQIERLLTADQTTEPG